MSFYIPIKEFILPGEKEDIVFPADQDRISIEFDDYTGAILVANGLVRKV